MVRTSEANTGREIFIVRKIEAAGYIGERQALISFGGASYKGLDPYTIPWLYLVVTTQTVPASHRSSNCFIQKCLNDVL